MDHPFTCLASEQAGEGGIIELVGERHGPKVGAAAAGPEQHGAQQGDDTPPGPPGSRRGRVAAALGTAGSGHQNLTLEPTVNCMI